MGPRTELVSLLLSTQDARSGGVPVTGLDRFTMEDRATVLLFLTRYGYLTRTRRADAMPDDGNYDRYSLTERGLALLREIAEH